MNWINLLLSSKGRINRARFIFGLLPIAVLLTLVIVYLKYLTGILPGWADMLISVLITIEACYFFAKLSMKRMHDYGRSAHYLWLLFAPLLFVGLFFIQQKFFHLTSYEGAVVVYTIVFSLAVIAFLWMLVEMLFLRSDVNSNKYGPAPLAKKK